MSLTYLLNAAWMAMTSFCAMPIIIYLMLRSICANEIEHRDYWFLDNYCLNLSRFGLLQAFQLLAFTSSTRQWKAYVCGSSIQSSVCPSVHLLTLSMHDVISPFLVDGF